MSVLKAKVHRLALAVWLAAASVVVAGLASLAGSLIALGARKLGGRRVLGGGAVAFLAAKGGGDGVGLRAAMEMGASSYQGKTSTVGM